MSALVDALRRTVGWIGLPAYAAAIASRNAAFDRGRGVTRLGLPVISVGNLSTGGTGKTPTVMWIARRLAQAGVAPAIAMRGYKGDGAGRSDEADEYRRCLPGVPLAVGADRVARLGELLASPAGARVRCIILDDGFQHRRIARDLDIVLIDATRPPWSDRLLPVGDLREPVASLARAGAIVLTHAERVVPEVIASMIAQLPDRPVAVARHTWSGLRVVDAAGPERAEPVQWLAGRRVLVLAAIGNGPAFADAVAAHVGPTGQVVPMLRPDHDALGPATIARAVAAVGEHRLSAVVTTEKDWSKIAPAAGASSERPAPPWPCPVVVPTLELTFDRGGDELASLALAAARGASAGVGGKSLSSSP